MAFVIELIFLGQASQCNGLVISEKNPENNPEWNVYIWWDHVFFSLYISPKVFIYPLNLVVFCSKQLWSILKRIHV